MNSPISRAAVDQSRPVPAHQRRNKVTASAYAFVVVSACPRARRTLIGCLTSRGQPAELPSRSALVQGGWWLSQRGTEIDNG
jgi:hypothetical protein